MAKKTVSTKIQIPKWYTKRIKNFEILTETEALFEYEALKIRERQRKYAKKAGIKGYKAPSIPRPSLTLKADVDYLRNIPQKEIKISATTGFDELVGPSAPIYNYEYEDWKEEKFPGYRASFDYLVSEDDYLSESDIREIESSFPSPEPEPTPPLFVDQNTGEAIFEEDLPDYIQHCKELIDDLIRFTEEQADQSIVSYSSYRSGRTKSSLSRQWLENNIIKAKNKVVTRLEAIQSDNSLMLTFAKKCATGDYLQSLQNAIGDYISGAYSDINAESYYSSQVYNLLTFSPMTLDDTMDFEDEE